MKIEDFEFTPEQVLTVKLVDYDNQVELRLVDGRTKVFDKRNGEHGRQTWNRVVDAITAERVRLGEIK